jgi:DNA-directed RNA polymerase specialized sigma24 family protein
VVTSRCLNAWRSAQRRQPAQVPPGVHPPEPTRHIEVTWLEPYPDVLLAGLADTEPGPEARYSARESISLAFIVAVQKLPPRQRAALILREVLGFPVTEAAGILGCDRGIGDKRARARPCHHAWSATVSRPALA